jgi:hypothetical protein
VAKCRRWQTRQCSFPGQPALMGVVQGEIWPGADVLLGPPGPATPASSDRQALGGFPGTLNPSARARQHRWKWEGVDDAQVLDRSGQHHVQEAEVAVGFGHDGLRFDHDDGVELEALG